MGVLWSPGQEGIPLNVKTTGTGVWLWVSGMRHLRERISGN